MPAVSRIISNESSLSARTPRQDGYGRGRGDSYTALDRRSFEDVLDNDFSVNAGVAHVDKVLRSHRFLFLARFVLHDVASHRAGRHRQRRSQIHLSRTAAAGKIAILRTDHHLVGTR